MNWLTVRGLSLDKAEPRTDPETGDTYIAKTFSGYGHRFEITDHQNGFYSGRADGDWRTAVTRKDEGGIVGWIVSKIRGG